MLKRLNPWFLVILIVLLSRFITMALFPFTDTTEPRYAEIARLMAETGDWITPWFEPGTPFWGKPPLSFWAQAGAIRLFGLSEFALRLPSWLASLGILVLTWLYARQLYGPSSGRWSTLVLATMALFYISAGAVMTDPFLALGTTLSLVSFGMVAAGRRHYWRWLFFLGLILGLLAKGPLAVVLTGAPLVLWLLWQRNRIDILQAFPWFGGLLLTCALTLPWYIAAELKTPGFLDYFIVGEHFRRFVDPGWTGDLYGNAHVQPKGMIWIFWIWASFPWGILALIASVSHFSTGKRKSILQALANNPQIGFILLCALTPLLFFTMAGNTIWTYVLPALPFSAILIARWISTSPVEATLHKWVRPLAAVVPILVTAVVFIEANQDRLKTEAALIAYYTTQLETADSSLLYLDKLPFSARFYSRGEARKVTLAELETMEQNQAKSQYFVAIPHSRTQEVLARLPASTKTVASNRRYLLLSLSDLQAPGKKLLR